MCWEADECLLVWERTRDFPWRTSDGFGVTVNKGTRSQRTQASWGERGSLFYIRVKAADGNFKKRINSKLVEEAQHPLSSAVPERQAGTRLTAGIGP